MALVEKNVPAYAQYSTHPPATYRIDQLAKNLYSQGKIDDAENAISILEVARSSPILEAVD
jgi:hypothetical protein